MQKRIKHNVVAIQIALVAAIIWAVAGCGADTNTADADTLTIEQNRISMQQRVAELCDDYKVVALEDLTPFAWDRVYTFGGYASAEQIYETVGYEWAPVRTGYDELAGNIVFMLGDQVVCHLQRDRYGLESEFNGFWFGRDMRADDHPRMIVSHIWPNETYLSLLDETYINRFDWAGQTIAPDVVGRWGTTVGHTVQGTSFVLSKEGVLSGLLHLPREPGALGECLPFTGVLMDDVARCQTEYVPPDEAGEGEYPAVEFEMALNDDKQFTVGMVGEYNCAEVIEMSDLDNNGK